LGTTPFDLCNLRARHWAIRRKNELFWANSLFSCPTNELLRLDNELFRPDKSLIGANNELFRPINQSIGANNRLNFPDNVLFGLIGHPFGAGKPLNWPNKPPNRPRKTSTDQIGRRTGSGFTLI
jgi:hypothetical protein